MDSRERVKLTLAHKEPDHVPFDLGGTDVTLIHKIAYHNLRRYLGLPARETEVAYSPGQVVIPDEDIAERLDTDIRIIRPQPAAGYELVFRDEGAFESYSDEWGIGWHKPKNSGLYYDMYDHPLAGADTISDIKRFGFPDPLDDHRYQNLHCDAESAIQKGKAIALAGAATGVLTMCSWLRGLEQFFVDLAANQDLIGYLLDRLVEFKAAYWQRALEEVGDLVDVVIEHDDLGGQNGLLFSPVTYRKLIKPRHRKLFSTIKEQGSVQLFYHSCGAVHPLIGDLIDVGVDILNPVQISATGMDPTVLKREFGRDLVFWGGGVDTQNVLGFGSVEQIKRHVKANVEALVPGGGFVFAAVHQIQANVPPKNIMAMWEAWRAFGFY